MFLAIMGGLLWGKQYFDIVWEFFKMLFGF